MPLTQFGGNPGFNFQYSIPSFQDYMGTTPTNILDLLQGYKTQQLAQQIAGQKELANLGYGSEMALKKTPSADLLSQLAGQKALQAQAAQEAIQNMREQSALQDRSRFSDIATQSNLEGLREALARKAYEDRAAAFSQYQRRGLFGPAMSPWGYTGNYGAIEGMPPRKR